MQYHFSQKGKMGFDDLTMESLRDRAATMKDCLARSQVITDSMTSILGSFDLRLSALETAMRPTQVSLFRFTNALLLFFEIKFFEIYECRLKRIR